MKRKSTIVSILFCISLFIICFHPVRAELGNNFYTMISSIKNQTYAKAAQTITYKEIFPYDFNFEIHKKHCKDVSYPFSVQIKNEKLTCMSADKYMLKINNEIYTYTYDSADSHLALVTIISGLSYPVSYNTYSYPEGVLKSVVVKITPDKTLIFDADGRLKRYSSPKMCVDKDYRVLDESESNLQSCNKLLSDDEYELNFEKD